jgi:glucose/arabinose dehydrogenase
MRTKRGNPGLAVFAALVLGSTIPAARAAITPADLSLVRFPDASTTFSQPIAIRAPDDGSGRVFVVERCSGIRIVKNGALLPTPFVSIATSCSSEQGILGLAFDPDFASNGTFYVTYTAPSGDPRLGSSADQVLARYTVSPPDGDVADPQGTVILRVPDIADNHNGGDLHFDHDGYLNWSMGDGGVQGDPNGFAQCTGRKKADGDPGSCHSTSGSGPTYYLLGKIIRLDVHRTTASAPSNFCGATAGQPAPYAVPPGNPFADPAQHPDDCAEIFNWGFRNPFRFSIDRATGDMLIGDVGQNTYEEVDFQPAGSPGQNFQWNQCEGFHTYPGGAASCTGPAGSVPPRLEYAHLAGRCAIIGGYRYRGPIAPLRGQYLFSDSCSGLIYVTADPQPSGAPWTWETLEGTPDMGTYGFGEDAEGNLYVADGGGKVYRFASESGSDLIFADGFDGTP